MTLEILTNCNNIYIFIVLLLPVFCDSLFSNTYLRTSQTIRPPMLTEQNGTVLAIRRNTLRETYRCISSWPGLEPATWKNIAGLSFPSEPTNRAIGANLDELQNLFLEDNQNISHASKRLLHVVSTLVPLHLVATLLCCALLAP